MSRTLAAILGGAAGAVALVGIILIILWYCLLHGSGVSRTSETGSSDPSVQVGRTTGIEFILQDARRFKIEELLLETRNFSDKSLTGHGKFGEVYKGLLHDGMLVAIKRRPGRPTQEFIDEEKRKEKWKFEDLGRACGGRAVKHYRPCAYQAGEGI